MVPQTKLDPKCLDGVVSDWPLGPLDEYRQKATFNWKQMKLLLEGEDVIRYKAIVWKTMEEDPLFHQTPQEEMTREEHRKLTFLRLKRLLEYTFLSKDDFMGNPMLVPATTCCVGSYDWSLVGKKFLSYEYFIASMRGAATKEQLSFLKDIKSFRALGAFSLTEMAHGSNVRAIKTVAHYDPKSQEFILNTPDLEATKVWSGDLGQTATHSVVFAQLYTPDGQCHGPHSFLVPIRDPNTLLPYPGLTVGDMGPKIGLNGLDNGFMQFNNYRIQRNSLMNKNADVTSDGRYVLKVKDKNKQFGASLGILSTGRIGIMNAGIINLQKAIIIAIRYSAVRRQFGPSNSTIEWPVIEYQMQQWRLFPYLAMAFVLNNFHTSFFKDYVNFNISITFGGVSQSETSQMGAEIHAICCSAKPYIGWTVRDAIQECREACGGHGYLKASQFGKLRDDHDPNNTYEGDNNVILQQTSNWLLKMYEEKKSTGKPIKSPFGSVDFIDNYDEILNRKTFSPITDINGIINAYRFIVCSLLKESDEKLKHELEMNNDPFTARSQSQVYYLRSLALTYIESLIIERFRQFLCDDAIPHDLFNVLTQIGNLYAYWSIEKRIPELYQFGYFDAANRDAAKSIRNAILIECSSLKNNAIALVDVIAPTDFILNSCLGKSDGKIYENLYDAIINSAGSSDRPDWWRLFTHVKPDIGSLRPKL